MVVLPLFIDFGNVIFSQKPYYFVYIHRRLLTLCVCDHLGLYIFPVNDSIDPIIFIGPYIFPINDSIDPSRAKDIFNPIGMLTCEVTKSYGH